MVDGAALVVAVTNLVSLAVYAYLATKLWGRAVSVEARLAASQFSLFWASLGAVAAINGIESLVAVFGTPTLAFVVTLLYLEVLLLCVLLWSLVGYLLYLYTGRNLALPLGVVYGAIYVLLLYYVAASLPSGVTLHQGMVMISFASSFDGPILTGLLLVLILPEIIGTFAYLSLLLRTRDPTVRYRVSLVGFGLLAYFGLALANVGTALGGSLAAQTVGQLVGPAVAIVVLLAFYPPASVRARYGIRGIEAAAAVDAS